MEKQNQIIERVSYVLSQLSGTCPLGQRLDSPLIHPFPARMPLSVAQFIIENLTKPESVILDPMSGSGTTLIAAKKLGRKSVGVERDPLSFLISRVSVRDYSRTCLKPLSDRILERADCLCRSGKFKLPKLRQNLPIQDQEFIRYWYPWQAQKQLFALANSITMEPDGPEKDLAWIVFSSLIIKKTKGVSYAMDITRSRPHKKIKHQTALPFSIWVKQFRIIINRLPFSDFINSTESTVYHGDARKLPLINESIDCVLTSPPYINAIDYLRSHKFSLIWMGYDIISIRSLRSTMVGTEVGLWGKDGLPNSIENQIANSENGRSRKAKIRKYLSDINLVLREINRVLRPSGIGILFIGPHLINKKSTEAIEVFRNLCKYNCLSMVGSSIRSLNSKRRSMPPPNAIKQSPLANRMREEVIIAVQKQS